MLNYEEVPSDLITGKDLDYLVDAFAWNIEALKKANDASNVVTDKDVLDVLSKASMLFDKNLNSVLNILESRGDVSE